ncbi:hypothetical protein SLEP1_g15397 [Rubroshorea leprosula]|uniref:Uncharacterized protein n=1 Tax=Rubroshorea leprosula TaxID=152421 RepID=A0AAV5IWM8_9ROSI|nr:hypothetical protein SLEP1_g15397 [Rubroshorea leprosula]
MADEELGSMLNQVRIFDVPIGMQSEQIGLTIGNSLGKVLEFDDSFHKAIKVRIDLDVNQPSRRFKTSQILITERHLDHNCEIANNIKDGGGKLVHLYGSWLKAKLEHSWCPDDLDILDGTFIINAQYIAGDMMVGNQERYETIANGASQVEGHNDNVVGDLEANANQMAWHNVNGVGEIADEIAQPLTSTVREMALTGNMEHTDGLPGLMQDQLVEIPLALGLDGIEQLTRKGNGAKGGWANENSISLVNRMFVK